MHLLLRNNNIISNNVGEGSRRGDLGKWCHQMFVKVNFPISLPHSRVFVVVERLCFDKHGLYIVFRSSVVLEEMVSVQSSSLITCNKTILVFNSVCAWWEYFKAHIIEKHPLLHFANATIVCIFRQIKE